MRPVWLSMHSVFSLDSKMNDVVGIIDMPRSAAQCHENYVFLKNPGILKKSGF